MGATDRVGVHSTGGSELPRHAKHAAADQHSLGEMGAWGSGQCMHELAWLLLLLLPLPAPATAAYGTHAMPRYGTHAFRSICPAAARPLPLLPDHMCMTD